MVLFQDRYEAGRRLAEELEDSADDGSVIVLGLPHGGVPVAYEVARALHVPLDVFLVRKLGLPGREQFSMGAVASGGMRVINKELVRLLDIPPEVIERVARREQEELERQEQIYRHHRSEAVLAGKTVILVDDGMATGATMRAAATAIRAEDPRRLIVAVPTAVLETYELFADEVDEVVWAAAPRPSQNIRHWYENFAQITDEEVCQLLELANETAVAT